MTLVLVWRTVGRAARERPALPTPFKLLLFVLVNGWLLLSRAVVLGYA